MKIRNGFVSNSSSSSFIVIGNESLTIPKFNGNELNIPEDFGGETEFGWGIETLSDFGSKLNFTYIQTTYKDGEEPLLNKALEAAEGHSNIWRSLLEGVLKDKFGVDKINWDIDGYIDHQSAAGEGENTEMFDSVHNMEQFLFAEDSCINLDNDNH